MKIKIRFTSFFTIALFCFLCYIGAVMVLLFDFVMPMLGAKDNLATFLAAFFFSFLSAAMLFSAILVKPLLLILTALNALNEKLYDLTDFNHIVRNKKGKIKKRYFLFHEAIMELNELASRLSLAEAEREQLEQAKQDWVRGISHDLKTPLSYILGYSALLSNTDYEWEPEEQQKFLKEIYSKGKYIEDLVGDLRLSFEIESPKTVIPLSPADFDLISFLQNLLTDVANNPKAAENDFSFQTEISSVTIHADERLLYRAFQNLLINSVLHNPKQTKISLFVFAPQNGLIQIKVTDYGIGLDETAQAVFTDESSYQQGWNGLAIVKNIILAHDGKISLESHKNEGSTFSIVLPL